MGECCLLNIAQVSSGAKMARDLLTALVKKNPSPIHREELAHAQNALASYQASFYTIEDKAQAVKIAQFSEQLCSLRCRFVLRR